MSVAEANSDVKSDVKPDVKSDVKPEVKPEKEKKIFSVEYQIEDDNGNPIGPPQHFEAETQKELLEKVTAAHKNSAKEMYKEKRARKIGDMITPDLDSPIKTFERRPLSADERVKIATAVKDPSTILEGLSMWAEAEFGASLDDVRQGLQFSEVQQRIQLANWETDKFLAAHPEYVMCSDNEDTLKKWLNKRRLAITHKNLELAYEDLGDVLVKQVKKKEKPVEKVPVSAAETPPNTAKAPVQPETIPLAATPAPAITDQPAEVQSAPELKPKASSSGLSRDSASVVQRAEPPKTKEIPYALIARMNSKEYESWMRDPANKEVVSLLNKR